MSFRKEKKFRLSKYDCDTLKNELRIKGMQSLYAKRVINSLYYDTVLCDMFNDSEEGLLPRKKVRIRWYDDIKRANKELKISSLEGRFKTSCLANIESESSLPQSLYDSQYGIISPALFVSYTREYFSFESMRLTFDSNIKYVNHRQSRFIFHKDGECVMEVKIGLETPDDYIERMLPFSISRFSKYSRGLLLSNDDL
jgi:hypothetical protein